MFLKPLLYLYAILPHEVRSYCWFRKKIVAYAKIELMWEYRRRIHHSEFNDKSEG
jgi:hypothetical protein